MKSPVCLGDDTTHGGKVIRVSSTFNFDDRKVALLHDIVSCPIHGDNPIIEHGHGFSDNGLPVAVDRCRTQCGSEVIASGCGVTIE
jgi:uncharacterized Zn-binding protein involved in type VI secretion